MKIKSYLKRMVVPLVAKAWGAHPRPVKIPFGPVRGKRVYIAPHQSLRIVLGIHERALCRALRRIVRRGDTAYDVGAHVGYVTLFLSSLVGSPGSVVAFELSATVSAALKKTIQLNSITNASVHTIGLYSARKDVPVSFRQHQWIAEIGESDLEGTQMGEVTDLDSYLDEHRLPLPSIIKMDIEGAEVEALRGMRSTLHAARPLLLIEFHSPDKLGDASAVLTPLGYALYSLRGKALALDMAQRAREFPTTYLYLDLSQARHVELPQRLGYSEQRQ